MKGKLVVLLAVFGIVGMMQAFAQPFVAIALFGVVGLVAIRLAGRGLAVLGVRRWLVLVTPLIAAGAIGCGGPRTPAPPAPITDPTDSAQRSAVLAYANSLEFAEDTNEYHGQFDRNLVDTLGTMVIVAPQVNIHNTRKRDLRRGRIQLKITITPRPGRPPTERYDSLTPGVTYVWVDSLVMTTPDRGTARAVYVPEDPAVPAWWRTITLYRTPHWNQPVARWTPAQCWVCERSGWCH